MKKMTGRRIISLIIILAMAVTALAGCGSSKRKNKGVSLAQADSECRYKEVPSPLTDILKSADSGTGEESVDDLGDGRFNFVSVTTADGRYYVLYSDLESENNSYLCRFDEEGKNGQIFPVPVEEEGSVINFCVLPDDNIVVLTSLYDLDKDVFNWQLCDYVPEEKEEAKLKEVWKKTVSTEEDFFASSMVAAEKEIYIQTDSDLRIYDSSDGSEKKKIEHPGSFYGNACKSPQGTILLAGTGDKGVVAYSYDPGTDKLQKTQFESKDIFIADAIASGCGDYDFFLASDDSVYGFRLDNPAPVRVLDCLASDLEVETISAFASLSAKTAVMICNDMDGETVASLFHKAEDDGQGQKTALSLACTYAGSDLRKAILNFNKSSDRYRVVLQEYPYDDEGNSTLTMEIASGNIPDMICISSEMPVESFAAKGLFEDLEPMFQADEELSRKEYLNNVLDAFRIDGKMYYITPSFNVIGLIGKKKDFGDTKGVTTAQIEKMMKERSLDYDMVMGVSSRDSMLAWVLYCALEEYVDWEKGTCSFNSESFINLLKFCARFPKKINYDNINWTQYEAAMREGRQLVRDGYLFSFSGYMQERYGYVGEEITFMGYPGDGENGPVVQSDLAVAISENSDYPEGCWEFLRSFYLDDYQQSVEYAFPISRKALLKMADKAMNPPVHTYEDENGETISEPETNSVYISDKEIKLPVPGQEDIDTVLNIIDSLDTKVSIDSKISDIINEESGAFFAGQKSAEETADIIQSRVKVYISETK